MTSRRQGRPKGSTRRDELLARRVAHLKDHGWRFTGHPGWDAELSALAQRFADARDRRRILDGHPWTYAQIAKVVGWTRQDRGGPLNPRNWTSRTAQEYVRLGRRLLVQDEAARKKLEAELRGLSLDERVALLGRKRGY